MAQLTHTRVLNALPDDGSWVTATYAAGVLGTPSTQLVKRRLDELMSMSKVDRSADRAITGFTRGTGYRRKPRKVGA